MQLSITDILRPVLILSGNSGAGKGVYVDETSVLCKENNIKLHGYASGNGFRGLFSIKEEDRSNDIKEALELMGKGAQVEGIYPISDSAVVAIKEHILALARGEKSILYLDGMWRNGEDESQITPGKRLPSQGLQLAGMFLTAIKELQESGQLKLNAEDEYLVGITEEQDLKTIGKDDRGISYIYESLHSDSNHIIVHVDDETAGTLMRVRSYFELNKIFWNLSKNTSEGDRKEKALEAMTDLLLIQSGSFDIRDGQIRLDNKYILDETKPFPEAYP